MIAVFDFFRSRLRTRSRTVIGSPSARLLWDGPPSSSSRYIFEPARDRLGGDVPIESGFDDLIESAEPAGGGFGREIAKPLPRRKTAPPNQPAGGVQWRFAPVTIELDDLISGGFSRCCE